VVVKVMADFIEGSFTIEKTVAQKFFEALGAFVPECRLHITKTGIFARAVDFANIGMVDVNLNVFTTFNYDHEIPTILGIDVSQIQNVFQVISDPDPVTFSWKRGVQKDLLNISSKNYELSFGLLDVNTIRKDPNPPILTLDTMFQVNGERLAIGVRLVSVITDNCYIEATPNSCVIGGEGEKTRSYYSLDSHSNTRAKARYSLDYLKDIVKVLKGVQVIVKIGDDRPLSIAMTDPPAPLAGLSINYLLAPRFDA
jgi:proliferating cell nuclear antigen